MKLIARPRQMGKTMDLIQHARKLGRTLIVCHNDMAADTMWRTIRKNGWDEDSVYIATGQPGGLPKPIGWESLPCSISSQTYSAVVLDNAEMILQGLLNKHGLHAQLTDVYGIAAITMSAIPEIDYDERNDWHEYEKFCTTNPSLTYAEFCTCKYGVNYNEI